MNVKKVSSKNLNVTYIIAQQPGSVRVGSTVNPTQRAPQYKSEGYRGTMYVAQTTNMQSGENRLLDARDYRHNQHTASNSSASPGYKYVISGQKKK